jgi:hypothetical protein
MLSDFTLSVVLMTVTATTASSVRGNWTAGASLQIGSSMKHQSIINDTTIGNSYGVANSTTTTLASTIFGGPVRENSTLTSNGHAPALLTTTVVITVSSENATTFENGQRKDLGINQ